MRIAWTASILPQLRSFQAETCEVQLIALRLTWLKSLGLTMDVALPIALSLGLGAARVAAVRVGRIKLIQHESLSGAKPGGHAILKHVGITQEELAARLKSTESMARRPNAVSSLSNIDVAEMSISNALKVNREWIKVWAAGHPGHNLVISYDTGRNIGYSLFHNSNTLTQATKVKIVLKYEMYNGKPYYILTAFPEV